MPKKVRKAIIPAAGYGTRLLPVTKTLPKEMLPIVDKPVIQYVVEEAVEAGIEEIIFITSSGKHPLEDYFDYSFELEESLKRKGKEEDFHKIRRIADMAKFAFIRQKEMRGTGHAVMAAKEFIGDEPFLVLWGDEIVAAEPNRSAQLVEIFNKTQAPVLAMTESKHSDDTKKYGFIKTESEGELLRAVDLIEKPHPDPAPSKYLSVGGMILTPEIFPYLDKTEESRGGEIYLADAVDKMMKDIPVYGCLLQGATYYDTGTRFGFIRANLELGLKHPEIQNELLEYIKSLRDA